MWHDPSLCKPRTLTRCCLDLGGAAGRDLGLWVLPGIHASIGGRTATLTHIIRDSAKTALGTTATALSNDWEPAVGRLGKVFVGVRSGCRPGVGPDSGARVVEGFLPTRTRIWTKIDSTGAELCVCVTVCEETSLEGLDVAQSWTSSAYFGAGGTNVR